MAKRIVIDPEDLEKTIRDITNTFFDGVATETQAALTESAASCAEDLRENSPKNTNEYSKSWTIQQTTRGKENNEVEIYNKRGSLTHLLEHGHVKVVHGKVCGTTAAKPHIRKAEQTAIRTLLDNINKGVEKAAKK